MIPDEKSDRAWVHNNENHAQKMAHFRRIGAKEPRHSETIFAKKRYTSIVARVRPRCVSTPQYTEERSTCEGTAVPHHSENKKEIGQQSAIYIVARIYTF